MLLENMYVRCPIDHDIYNPRDFITGQIVKVDLFSEVVDVVFYDPFNYREYYESFPKSVQLPFSMVKRCKVFKGAEILVDNELYTVISCKKNESGYYQYYLESVYEQTIFVASEKDIVVPFIIGSIDPIIQLKSYEFQNPCWLFGRNIVNKTMSILENSMYGFKELAGCKIFLMPHQLKTIMRCLQGEGCRYMLADEVGMGKTIEAAAILKVSFSRSSDINALIVAPESLLDQWKTELFFKFDLYEGENENNNYITFCTLEEATINMCRQEWDFTIIDEVHRLLIQKKDYDKFHELCKNSENVLLLSATPVQQKRSDYLDLLRLIMPHKYDECSKEKFDELVEKQGNITKHAAMVLSNIEDLDEIIKDCIETEDDVHDNEDCEDFFEDISSGFKKLYNIVNDDMFKSMYDRADFDSNDVGIHEFKIAISYLCENYQIEKNIIRNRRDSLQDLPKRELVGLPYMLDSNKNFYEYSTYQSLVEWVTSANISESDFEKVFKPLFGSFFSSPWAFNKIIQTMKEERIEVPIELFENIHRWTLYEKDIRENIMEILDNPEEYSSRIVNTMFYLDEYVGDDKIVIFTHYKETFEIYQGILEEFYTADGFSCFMKGMSSEELETNVCKFQTDKNCTIMLCDESGGEGRNFQCADYVLHIDLPWDANIIEQRVGRLDRMGRDSERDIVSVIPYAEETLEEELFKFWDRGLNIFKHSLSGLEIIMNDINNAIVDAIIKDFKFGLTNEIEKVIERAAKLKEEVREEQHFDTAAYIYRPMNQELISLVKYYTRNENKLFSDAMLEWAKLSGFRDVLEKEGIVSFNERSFSTKSAENSLLIPPNWDEYFAKKHNVFIEKIRTLRNEKTNVNKIFAGRTIEGTFDRKKAIENDYIHFYAPGDEIFDCIVDNAMRSCRGQSAAFAMIAPFEWRGFIYTWSLSPNEQMLLEKGIPLSYLSSLRNYLALEQVQIPVGFKNYAEISDQKVLREFERLSRSDYECIKDEIDHLGRRSTRDGFLGISRKHKASNVDFFKARYPKDKWESMVDQSKKVSKEKALRILRERSHIKEAREEVERIITSEIATAKFYEIETDNIEHLQEIYNTVISCLAKPIVRLESACFIWMVKK